MSHDQKPAKMRVVGNSMGRRRGDMVPAPAAVAPPPVRTGATEASGTARKPILVLAGLFVLGCALGGAALPLLGVL